MYTHVPDPPIGSTAVSARWNEQRRRRRLLEGGWRGDLHSRAVELVGGMRRDAWGFLDMSANPFRQLCDQFATLYDHEPLVRHALADELGVATLERALADSGYWALMQRVQRDTIGLRHGFVRIDIDDDAALIYERIAPDTVYEVDYSPSGRRVEHFAHLRLRQDRETGRLRWYWDVLSVSGGVGQYAVVQDAGGSPLGADVSPDYLSTPTGAPAPPGGLSGDLYPYIDGEGRPYVPVVHYRAQLTGRAGWDHLTWSEVVEGTLNVAVYWSFWGHVLRSASWPQRYAAGVHVRSHLIEGAASVAGAQRRGVVTDPATLLEFDLDEDFTGQPVIGQFNPGGDANSLASAISVYEARIAAGVGVSPSDLTRTSGDPRSGYALAVSNEALRKQQRRYEPAFRQGDMIALEIITAQLNRIAGVGLPERGWRPEYVSLPLSVAERQELRSEVFELLDRRFIDETEAMRRLSGSTMTRDQARAALEQARAAAPAAAPDRSEE